MENSNILLISTCKYTLHENEFVKPLEQICIESQFNVILTHISKLSKLNLETNTISKIIICGTALKDFEYEQFDLFSFFEKTDTLNIPTFGICAGAQILAKHHNIQLIENKQIGIKELTYLTSEETFQAYVLHSKSIKENEKIESILYLESEPEIIELCQIKNSNLTLAFFHPEIKNKEIIKNWLTDNKELLN